MKQRNYSSEAIVLARRKYSEADRILIVFSKDFGKLALIAKGVRKLKSKKRGHIEVFNHIKFSAAKTRGLDIITEAEVINTFSRIRKNLKKVALAYYFMEVVGKTTQEEEKHKEVFDLILKYLQRTEKERGLKKIRLEFVQELLTTLGFWPKNKKIYDVDKTLEEVTERQINSKRVGKLILR